MLLKIDSQLANQASMFVKYMEAMLDKYNTGEEEDHGSDACGVPKHGTRIKARRSAMRTPIIVAPKSRRCGESGPVSEAELLDGQLLPPAPRRAPGAVLDRDMIETFRNEKDDSLLCLVPAPELKKERVTLPATVSTSFTGKNIMLASPQQAYNSDPEQSPTLCGSSVNSTERPLHSASVASLAKFLRPSSELWQEDASFALKVHDAQEHSSIALLETELSRISAESSASSAGGKTKSHRG
ncbi:unnamed protein product, partial [Amoebophrya sp. A120]|eukprot:GSA120T00016889001.1